MNDNFLRVIASLHRDGVNLDLKTVDICFLVALHARADQSGLTCFEEDVLLDVFEQVCDAVEADADNVAKRATHAIQRLRDQRLLARVDGAGVVRAGEYALTQLALGIIRFFQADEALTRESLTLLTKTLLASLAEAKANAKQASSPEQWREGVIGPLRVTVGDLVGGIERRQRGLDLQQEQVQKRIGELLQEDWFGAIDQCQSLLDETTSTLAEMRPHLRWRNSTRCFSATPTRFRPFSATSSNWRRRPTCRMRSRPSIVSANKWIGLLLGAVRGKGHGLTSTSTSIGSSGMWCGWTRIALSASVSATDWPIGRVSRSPW